MWFFQAEVRRPKLPCARAQFHLMEAVLSLLGVQAFARHDGIRDGKNRERLLSAVHGCQVGGSRLHLHAQMTALSGLLIDLFVRIVEEIRGEYLAEVRAYAQLPCGINRKLEQIKACRGRHHALKRIDSGHGRVGRRGHGDHDVPDMYAFLKGSGGSDADDRLHPEEGVKLIGIQGEGGHSHTGTHDRDFFSLICAGIAVHIPYIVEEDRILQIMLRDILRAQRISRHQDDFRDMGTFLELDAGRR